MPEAMPAATAGTPMAVPTYPLADELLRWLVERLWAKGVLRPTCKRLAVLTAGLLETATVRRGDLTAAVARLHLSDAREPSIARRLERLLADPPLDPERIVPLLQAELVPTLLADACAAHAALAAAGGRAHRRWFPLHVIVDETSVRDQVHVLAAGLAYQGVAVPLAVRTWPQNVPLPPGEYWRHRHALLAEVQAVLPPELRDHVVLVADRGYGVPRLVDLAQALGWAWVLRLQGPTTVRLGDGRVLTAAALAPRPGTAACTAGTLDALLDADQAAAPPPAADGAAPADHARWGVPDAPVAAFRGAGWRPCQVVAVWAESADEPWLLATNLPAERQRCLTYGRRWSIERLFLHWKSHGWDLELLQQPTPPRVGRLLTGLVLATLWTLAIAHTSALLANAATAAQRQPLQQPHLPGLAPTPRDSRPWPAKKSLLTGGRQVLAATSPAVRTPARCWVFPDWETPTWQAFCQQRSA